MKSPLIRSLPLLLSLSFHLNMPNVCLTQSPITLAEIQITFSNNGQYTLFSLVWENSAPNTWLAVGLNTNPEMVGKIFSPFLPY